MTASVPGRSRRSWGRARLVVPLVLVGLLLAGAAWQPHDPHAVDLDRMLAPPGAGHWLGTDHLGRDLASRLMAGAGPSLLAAGVALAVTLGLGGAAGAMIALSGGAVAALVSRAAEVALALPTLVVALVVSAVLGAGPLTAALALSASAWAPYALAIAALAERVRVEPFFLASTAMGVSRPRAMLRHVVPQIAGPVGALAGADAGRAVVLVASLGFLGIAADTGAPEWGAMVHEYRALLFDAPRLVLAPILAIAGLSLAFHAALDRGESDRRRR